MGESYPFFFKKKAQTNANDERINAAAAKKFYSIP